MLTIGVIGYSIADTKNKVMPLLLTILGRKVIALRNKGNEIICENGTVYVLLSEPEDILGRRLDQLIIADDSRWEIYKKQHELIALATRTLSNSFVPEQFKIQELEL